MSHRAQTYVWEMGKDRIIRRVILILVAVVLGLVVVCLMMHKLMAVKKLFM